jgi:hypothetical protein
LRDGLGADSAGWIGRQVELFVVPTRVNGVEREGVRIRTISTATAPSPRREDPAHTEPTEQPPSVRATRQRRPDRQDKPDPKTEPPLPLGLPDDEIAF